MADKIKDIFGDSESEDEAPVAGGDDVFDDSEDEAPKAPAPKSRLKKKGDKKAVKGDKKKSDKKAAEPAADSAEAYESDGDVAANADDRAFIDTEGDDEELLDEYKKDRQNFNDDEVDNEFEAAEERSAKPAKDDDNPLTAAMNSLKRQRRKEMSTDDKDRVVGKLLERKDPRMNAAAEQDKQSQAAGRPALAKLDLLPVVCRVLKQQALHTALLEHDALIEVRTWLEPNADGHLPSLGLRTAMLEALQPLPANVEALKRSRLGVLIMRYTRDAREIPSNQRLARQLVQVWSRPVVGKETDYRALEAAQERFAQQSVRGRIAQLDSGRDDVQDLVAKNNAERAERAGPGAPPSSRIQVPQFSGFSFTIRPTASVDSSANQAGRRRPEKHGAETAKGRLAKKMKKR